MSEFSRRDFASMVVPGVFALSAIPDGSVAVSPDDDEEQRPSNVTGCIIRTRPDSTTPLITFRANGKHEVHLDRYYLCPLEDLPEELVERLRLDDEGRST